MFKYEPHSLNKDVHFINAPHQVSRDLKKIPHMGMSAILVILPGPFIQNLISSPHKEAPYHMTFGFDWVELFQRRISLKIERRQHQRMPIPAEEIRCVFDDI